MGLSDQQARAVLRDAFALRGMTSPSVAELQIVQAIGRFEGGYGFGIPGATNNWGAVQCGQKAPCPPGCAEHGDSHADGTKYRGCFRIYPSPVAGAADLVHQLYRRAGVPEALRAGNAELVAERMRATHYFEAPAAKYAQGIRLNTEAIAKALGEPWIGASPPPAPPPSPTVEPGGGGGGALALSIVVGVLMRRRFA